MTKLVLILLAVLVLGVVVTKHSTTASTDNAYQCLHNRAQCAANDVDCLARSEDSCATH